MPFEFELFIKLPKLTANVNRSLRKWNIVYNTGLFRENWLKRQYVGLSYLSLRRKWNIVYNTGLFWKKLTKKSVGFCHIFCFIKVPCQIKFTQNEVSFLKLLYFKGGKNHTKRINNFKFKSLDFIMYYYQYCRNLKQKS